MTISNAQKYLLHNDIKAFYLVIDAMDFDSGVRALLEVNGIGKMQSNVLLMGFKHDWATCDIQSLEKYFAVIQSELFLISLAPNNSNSRKRTLQFQQNTPNLELILPSIDQ